MSTFRQHLVATYHFDEWQGQTTSERMLLIKGYFLSPWQVPGWHLLRQRVLSQPGGPSKYVAYLSDSEQRSERGMTVSFVECESVRAAHEQLLTLLGEFQSPEVVRDRSSDSPCGDVCFVGPGRTSALFSRGNLVFLVQRAERAAVPIMETASDLDHVIVSPGHPSTQRQPELHGLRLKEEAAAVGTTRIEATVNGPIQRPCWLRYSATGVAELWMDTTGAVHARTQAGDQGSVEVTAYDDQGGWSSAASTLLR